MRKHVGKLWVGLALGLLALAPAGALAQSGGGSGKQKQSGYQSTEEETESQTSGSTGSRQGGASGQEIEGQGSTSGQSGLSGKPGKAGEQQASTGGQEKGSFDEPYLWGLFNEESASTRSEWFYDRYSYDSSRTDWTDVPWYSQPQAFSGLFNDNLRNNDWFFDAYGPSTNDLFRQ